MSNCSLDVRYCEPSSGTELFPRTAVRSSSRLLLCSARASVTRTAASEDASEGAAWAAGLEASSFSRTSCSARIGATSPSASEPLMRSARAASASLTSSLLLTMSP